METESCLEISRIVEAMIDCVNNNRYGSKSESDLFAHDNLSGAFGEHAANRARFRVIFVERAEKSCAFVFADGYQHSAGCLRIEEQLDHVLIDRVSDLHIRAHVFTIRFITDRKSVV